MRDDARRFENWETSHATKLGLGAAVDYALALGPESTWARIEALGRGAAGAAWPRSTGSRCTTRANGGAAS